MRLPKLRRRRGGIIDQRGRSAGSFGFPAGGGISFPGSSGPGGFRLPLGLPVGTIIVIALAFGACQLLRGGGLIPDPGAIDIGLPGVAPAPGGSDLEQTDPKDKVGAFVDAVADDIQLTWKETFARGDERYEFTSITLFTDEVSTACGLADSAVGPFYCPADQRVYIDLGFFHELERRFGAPGDFAEAYVIAHEIAHHVQNLLGLNRQVQEASAADRDRSNELSIRLELQADCLAGVWARSANSRGILEPGDLEEGMTAAASVGDDRIQRSTSGRVNPETWTHGSSEQRTSWLRTGFQIGNPDACDTFSVEASEL